MARAFSRYVEGTASASSATAAFDLSVCSVGDLALVIISRSNDTAVSVEASGWTGLQSHTGTARVLLYGKTLAAGDIGTATWTFGDAAKVRGTAGVYTGAAIASSAKGAWNAAATGTTVDCGSISTSSPWVVQLCTCYWTEATTYDALSGYTERRDAGDVDSDRWNLVADTNGTWGGGACAPDFTVSLTSSRRGGFLVELEEAAGGDAWTGLTVIHDVSG
jgi:hypothetical protein